MDRLPDELRDFSLRLSRVLDDIGVNERTVMMRRRTRLLNESLKALHDYVSRICLTSFYFGSQSEGTTTFGLHSDSDTLMCDNDFNVIQDWSEWQQGKINLLMLRDNVSPGYCRLQMLRSDIPVARKNLPTCHGEYDTEGQVLLKNTWYHSYSRKIPGLIRHGPALSNADLNTDIVIGLNCRSWPAEALPWITRTAADQWPGRNLKCFAINNGCFVVPTGHCLSETERLEWRISTSLAERCLMLNMNITQIRCYVVLKMIMKTFLNRTLSSYQCKTVLMNLIELTSPELWREENLIPCIIVCLRLLQLCVFKNNCPHHFIPKNNLLGGRFEIATRQYIILAIENVIDRNCLAILGIKIDNIGDRLCATYNPFHIGSYLLVPTKEVNRIDNQQNLYLFYKLHFHYLNIVNVSNNTHSHTINCDCMQNGIHKMFGFHENGNCSQRVGVEMITPLLCTTLGTMLASADMARGQCISAESLQWLSLGIDSDVASGRLKLASVLFCSGEIDRASVILRDVEQRYDTTVTEPICGCGSSKVTGNFSDLRFLENIQFNTDFRAVLKTNVGFGVHFTPCEIECVPHALQYEMFRCTEEELRTTIERFPCWMNWAAVDSLPYLYYLQYMTYRRHGNHADQHRALNRLINTIVTEPRLFHRETALNILGQCMELEDRLMDAFNCYRLSLNMTPTHNGARWHTVNLIRRLLLS